MRLTAIDNSSKHLSAKGTPFLFTFTGGGAKELGRSPLEPQQSFLSML